MLSILVFFYSVSLVGARGTEELNLHTWSAKISEKVAKWRNARKPRLLQNATGNTVDLEVLCQQMLALDSGFDGLDCGCYPLENGNVEYKCTETGCPYCDESLEVCGILSYGVEFGAEGAPPEFIVSEKVAIEYTSGLEGTIAFSFGGCDFTDPFVPGCAECKTFVDYEQCTSCSFCDGDLFLVSVDCENLATGSSFECVEEPPLDGIFRGLAFYECNYGPPQNDLCTNSTSLTLNQAAIGTTVGATSDAVESDCGTFNNGPGIWYSVVGTGSMMMVSTCSSSTYTETSFDIYSGDEGCENLLCTSFVALPCGGLYSGGE